METGGKFFTEESFQPSATTNVRSDPELITFFIFSPSSLRTRFPLLYSKRRGGKDIT